MSRDSLGRFVSKIDAGTHARESAGVRALDEPLSKPGGKFAVGEAIEDTASDEIADASKRGTFAVGSARLAPEYKALGRYKRAHPKRVRIKPDELVGR